MFEKTFCSSPWLHMRIGPDGEFGSCRWVQQIPRGHNIRNYSVQDYFQTVMFDMRQQFLQGQVPDVCHPCLTMEQHGKVSGRQRQLLKVGIIQDHFLPSLKSSPFFDEFRHSLENNGATDLMPVDWQIDLGNYCNSACVMCSPRYSSRLAAEFKKLGLADHRQQNWSDDPVLLEKFCRELVSGPPPAYLHLLGGETLIIPAFKILLDRLLDAGMTDTAIGFTTNLTVWPESVIESLSKFKNLHVGLSIETLHSVNQYVRWPGLQNTILENLEKWIAFSKDRGHLIQLRPTPSALTITHVWDLYEYAWNKKIGVETCNFIYHPRCLSLKVLPQSIRQIAIERLEKFISDKDVSHSRIINTRNPDTITQQSVEDAVSYINFLKSTEEDPIGAKELVSYLKKLEANRGNRVLDYLPEYEKFLRSHGY